MRNGTQRRSPYENRLLELDELPAFEIVNRVVELWVIDQPGCGCAGTGSVRLRVVCLL